MLVHRSTYVTACYLKKHSTHVLANCIHSTTRPRNQHQQQNAIPGPDYPALGAPGSIIPVDKPSLQSILQQIKYVFPNKDDLFPRIDSILKELELSGENLNPESEASKPAEIVSTIGIIPFKSHRVDIKQVIDVLLADPLASDQSWYTALTNRILSKDTCIKWDPGFEYIETSNSLVEYPIPFNLRSHAPNPDPKNFQFIEVNSWNDSKKHILNAHLHVFVSTNVQTALTNKLPSEYPSVLVIDQESLAGSNLGDNVIAISTDLASKAIKKLQDSPGNVSEYEDLMEKSNLKALEIRLFRPHGAPRRDLLQSISDTCEKCIVTDAVDATAAVYPKRGFFASLIGQKLSDIYSVTASETKNIENLRKEWSRKSHTELQNTLSMSLDELEFNSLAWYKLYYKVDDVHDLTCLTVANNYLPQARSNLEYLVGRIDSFADKTYQVSISDDEAKVPEVSGELFNYNELLSVDAVELHNKALKALTTSVFGIQLPCIVIPILGWYFYDYTMFSMGSIMALGLVVGFRHLQRTWYKSFGLFKNRVLEKARGSLSMGESFIWSRWEAKVLKQKELVHQRSQLVAELKKLLS